MPDSVFYSLEYLGDVLMRWYVIWSVIYLPTVVCHYLKTPRERWKQEFFRGIFWCLIAGYVIFWAFQRYVLPPR